MNKDRDEMKPAIQQTSGHQSNKNHDTKRKQQQKRGKFKTPRRKQKWGSHLCTG